MNEPAGPVLDWVRQLLEGLWQMLKDAYEHVAARADRLEDRLTWGFWILLAVVVLHGILTRPRK
jgi:hypothetical protein